MDCIELNDGRICDIVPWHTKQKHVFIEKYFEIWENNVGRTGKFKPFLSIFDLYSSNGWCYCDDTDKYGDSEKIWQGSALLSAECLEKYEHSKKLFLNTYHENPEKRSQQKKSLNQALQRFPKIFNDTIIRDLPISESIDEAIKYLDPNWPSIWILDPCAASHLPWEIVEKIANQQAIIPNFGIRKPEMIINLMTSGLQRNVDRSEKMVKTALGFNKDEWEEKFDQKLDVGLNYREAIIDIYGEKLKTLYDRPPIITEVYDTTQKAIVYCLFLCTDSKAGHYMFKVNKLQEFKNWVMYEWGNTADMIAKRKSLGLGQKTLF